MTTQHTWFEVNGVNRETEGICLALMEDIYADTGVTFYPAVDKSGYYYLVAGGGAGGTFTIKNGIGDLPDGDTIVFRHWEDGTRVPVALVMFSTLDGDATWAQLTERIIFSINDRKATRCTRGHERPAEGGECLLCKQTRNTERTDRTAEYERRTEKRREASRNET